MKIKDAVQGLKAIYPNCTDDHAFDLVKHAYNDMCSLFPIRVKESSQALIENQREYRLFGQHKVIWAVEYHFSDSDWISLHSSDVDFMEKFHEGWRHEQSSTPLRYYIWAGEDGAVLGLIPAPMNSTGDNGYPHVKIYSSAIQEDITLETEIPDSLPDIYSIVYESAYRYAAERGTPEELDRYMILSNMEKERVGRWIRGRDVRTSPSITPMVVRNMPRVI